jgi:1-acyl-sn-glycerol-3-phosphate acyltransferase
VSDAPRMPRARLIGLERLLVPLHDAVNLSRPLKSTVQFVVRHFSARWVRACTRNLVTLHGLDPLRELQPPRGVILVSNHRSFFDMYVTSAFLYAHTRFLRRLYFPVRSDFFYTHVLGALLNLLISGGAMWPPVFRDQRRTTLNPVGLQQLRHVLSEPGAVVGIHPEGTRGKGPDPHTFLKARAGVGELVHTVPDDVLVVPFFIVGLSNDFLGEVLSNFGIRPKRGVRIRFGTPFTAGEARAWGGPGEAARQIFARVVALSEEDRAEHGGVPGGAPTDAASLG